MKWYVPQLPCLISYDLPYLWDLGQGSGEDVVRGECGLRALTMFLPPSQAKEQGPCAPFCDSVSLHEKTRACVDCGCCTARIRVAEGGVGVREIPRSHSLWMVPSG